MTRYTATSKNARFSSSQVETEQNLGIGSMTSHKTGRLLATLTRDADDFAQT
jgi:hypothetical protein